MTRKYRIAVLNGDGIGPEVVPSARKVLEAASAMNGLNLELVELPIGFEAYRKYGRTFPEETSATLSSFDGWLLGPLEAGKYPKEDPDYPFASGKIRKLFDLYANIRPVRSLLNFDPCHFRKDVDMVIVRENTEDIYPDRNILRGNGEFWADPDTVVGLRIVTRRACRRIAETAFSLAKTRKRMIVTAVHKANVLIEGDGLFLTEVRSAKKNYPEVALEEKLVDSASMQLVMTPQDFDVLVTMNLFGDILSDEAAGLVGGLGLAPSLNSGEKYAMAQAVHGSAPDISGLGVANPVAEILSCVMLLDWLYSSKAASSDDSLRRTARSIEGAVLAMLASRDTKDKTRDVSGEASTAGFTERLLARITGKSRAPSSSLCLSANDFQFPQ